MNKEEKISNQELIKLATRALNKMINSGGGSFTMCVPPRHDDTDSIFAELISRFSQSQSDAVEEEARAYAKYILTKFWDVIEKEADKILDWHSFEKYLKWKEEQK